MSAAPPFPRVSGRDDVVRLLGADPEDLVASGALRRVREGAWADALARPPVTDAEVAAFLRPGAVVSLHTVLGESGALNNYPYDVWSVLPDAAADDALPAGDGRGFRFVAIDGTALRAAGDEGMDGRFAYPRATVEAALAHWLWLARAGRLAEPAPFDVDMAEVDQARLARACDAMGVGPDLAAWLGRRPDDDEAPVSDALGF